MSEELKVVLRRSEQHSGFGFSLLGTTGPPHVIYDIVENSPAADCGAVSEANTTAHRSCSSSAPLCVLCVIPFPSGTGGLAESSHRAAHATPSYPPTVDPRPPLPMTSSTTGHWKQPAKKQKQQLPCWPHFWQRHILDYSRASTRHTAQ